MTGFHAPDLARGWLATALASTADKGLTQLDRTIAIEDYPHGIRLVATDRFTLLTAWVPNIDTPSDREPELDEAPDRTVIVWDKDGRGKGLLGYLLGLWNRLEPAEREFKAEDGTFTLDLAYDVRLPAGSALAPTDETLEGLEPSYVVLDVKDTERVYLPVIEALYPSWRAIVHGHVAESTKAIRLNPDRLAILGKLGKYAGDAPPFIEWTFMGAERAALLDMPETWPRIRGVVMPTKWVTEHDPEPKETSVGDENCPTCADGRVCLKHASGVVTAEDVDRETAAHAATTLGASLQPGESLVVRGPETLRCRRCDWTLEVSTEDPDSSLSEAVHHGASAHGLDSETMLREVHGLEDDA